MNKHDNDPYEIIKNPDNYLLQDVMRAVRRKLEPNEADFDRKMGWKVGTTSAIERGFDPIPKRSLEKLENYCSEFVNGYTYGTLTQKNLDYRVTKSAERGR